MNFLTGSNDLGTLGLGLLIAGAAAGLFGGILGRGAGLILVSALFLVARSAGIGTDLAMHLAVGTSFACLLPLSLGLLAAHGRSLDWGVVRRWTLGLIAGTAAGLAVALRLPGAQLALVFAAVAVAAAAMAVWVKDRENVKPSRGLFGYAMAFVTGTTAGALGLSGAALGNPLLALCGLLRARSRSHCRLVRRRHHRDGRDCNGRQRIRLGGTTKILVRLRQFAGVRCDRAGDVRHQPDRRPLRARNRHQAVTPVVRRGRSLVRGARGVERGGVKTSE